MIHNFVIGASGQIGWHLAQLFKRRQYSVAGTYWRHSLSEPNFYSLDIRDAGQVKKVIQHLEPKVIYIPASFTNVEECEREPAATQEINVQGVKNIIEAARLTGSQTVYFSSDYIFDGQAGPYTEENEPNPICEYGRQKLQAEKIILSEGINPLVIRTTVVYSWEPQHKNFVVRLIEKLEKNLAIQVPYDQVGNPTYAPSLCEATLNLVEASCSGIYNAVGLERANRYEFALEVARVFSLNPQLIVPVTTQAFNQLAPRPLQAGLRTEKLKKAIGTHLPGYQNGLIAMKDAPNG